MVDLNDKWSFDLNENVRVKNLIDIVNFFQ